jgi:hypothetical protein
MASGLFRPEHLFLNSKKADCSLVPIRVGQQSSGVSSMHVFESGSRVLGFQLVKSGFNLL